MNHSNNNSNTTPWKTQLLRGGNKKIIEYILLAEFDIDTGSTLKYYYPTKDTSDNNNNNNNNNKDIIDIYGKDYFAEQMLPEGAHNRTIDYSYLILNRKFKHVDHHLWIHPININNNNTDNKNSTDNTDGNIDKNLLYGINIIKTKYDDTVRRGAIVKSLCILSKYQYINSFKLLLDNVLDSYYNNNDYNILINFYNTVNHIDISQLSRPNYVELLLMKNYTNYNNISNAKGQSNSDWEISLVMKMYNDKEKNNEKNNNDFDIDNNNNVSFDDNEETDNNINNTTNNNNVSKTVSNEIIELRKSFRKHPASKEIVLKIPLYLTPDDINISNITLLINTFGGEGVMKIYNNILLKKRVLFVGYNHSARDIAEIVFSSIAMLSPPITNIITRTYPYANLSDLSFLEVPGYIAGVTNPMFQQRDTWWDLLCVLDLPNGTGQIISSDDKMQNSSGSNKTTGSSNNLSSMDDNNNRVSGGLTPTTHTMHGGGSSKTASRSNLTISNNYEDNSYFSLDMKFISGVISFISATNNNTNNSNDNNEEWIRQQFYNYTQSILQSVYDKGITLDRRKLSSQYIKYLDANSSRIRVLEGSSEVNNMPIHPWIWCTQNMNNGKAVETSQQESNNTTNDNTAAGNKVLLSNSGSSKLGSRRSSKLLSKSMESVEVSRLLSKDASIKLDTIYDNEDNNNNGNNDNEDYSADNTTTNINDINYSDSESDTSSDNSIASSNVSFADSNTLGLIIRSYIRKLLYEKNNNSKEIQLYYELMEHYLRSEQSLQALLVLLPLSIGGITIIAIGLFHENPNVRYSVTMILHRLQLYESTIRSYDNLLHIYHIKYNHEINKINNNKHYNDIKEYRRRSKGHYNTTTITTTIANTNSNIVSNKNDIPKTVGEVMSNSTGDVVKDAIDGANVVLGSLLQTTLTFMNADNNNNNANNNNDDNDNNTVPPYIDEVDLFP